MGMPLILVENFFNTVMFTGHTVSADEEASGYEAFRVGTGRRSAQNRWQPETADADHEVYVDCDQLRGADMIVLDRNTNLSGKPVKLRGTNDDGATYWDMLDLTLPDLSVPGGSIDDAVGAVTEDGAWLKRFDLDAAMRWSLHVPAAAGFTPQVGGLYVGKAWEMASLFELPWSDDTVDLAYDAVVTDAGWEGATDAAAVRTGVMRIRLADYSEYDLARYASSLLRRHPGWILYDLDVGSRAVLVKLPRGEHGWRFDRGWGYRQQDIAWREHEPTSYVGAGSDYYVGTTSQQIGTPGDTGFGVGEYPGTLPTGITALTGHDTIGHDNYGNYLVGNSQSTMVWIPRFWYRIENDTDAPYYGNRVHIRSTPAPGYALHRAFIDGGEIKAGFFVDKYLWSNAQADGTDNEDTTAGIAASIANRRPVSANSVNNPISNLTGNSQTPTETLGGMFAAAKSRGDDFAPISCFCSSALAMLSLAHAQALLDSEGDPITDAATYAAWMDVAPYAPKGCDNDALGDAQDAAVSYAGAGYSNQPLTGSGNPFAKTTHNGQACGVADLNGAMWEFACGFTNIGSTADDYYILSESIALKDLVDGTSGATAAFAADPYDAMDAVWWTDAAAYYYFGNPTNLTLDPATDRAAQGYHFSALGIIRDADGGGASQTATNSFGGDGLYRKHTNLLAPLTGGHWHYGSAAGVWALYLSTYRSHSSTRNGSRAVLYV